jgi:hypothetical protein
MYFPRQYYDRQERDKLKSSSLIQGVGISTEQAVDLENSPEVVNSLDYKTWLPFAAKTYKISPRIEDYILKPMPICPSDFPNRNGIGFPLQELIAFQPPPMNRQVFKAWTGCPTHLEHANEDCTKAYGVVFDTALTQVKGFGQGKHYKVMGLVGVDKNKYPDIAQEVLDGRIITGSMGAMADNFSCSVCDRPATDDKYMNCSHVGSSKEVNWRLVDYKGAQHIAYLNAHQLTPIEYSLVRDPAWCQSLSEQLLSW